MDGCEPKPCENGQVHKTATNLTCIPEQFCTEKPCTVIDGVPYREGERIENRDIGDACQSWYDINWLTCELLSNKLNVCVKGFDLIYISKWNICRIIMHTYLCVYV